jgi:hypothetical protein
MTDDDAMTAELAPPPADPERHDYDAMGCLSPKAVLGRVALAVAAAVVLTVTGVAYAHGGGA